MYQDGEYVREYERKGFGQEWKYWYDIGQVKEKAVYRNGIRQELFSYLVQEGIISQSPSLKLSRGTQPRDVTKNRILNSRR